MQLKGKCYGSLDHRKVKFLTQEEKANSKVFFIKTDGRALWLIEVFNQKGCPMSLIGSKESCMHKKKQGPDSRDEKVICLLSNFLERQTDIVAYIEVLYAIKRDLLRSIFKLKEWNSLEINNVDIQNVQVEHNMNIYSIKNKFIRKHYSRNIKWK